MSDGLRKKKQPKAKIVSLNEDQACYVLITCGKPSADGKMSVEMTYEGDPVLAAYLLENAQELINFGDGLDCQMQQI